MSDVKDVEENDVQQLEALGETSSPAGRSYDPAPWRQRLRHVSLYISKVHDQAITLWCCILQLEIFTSTECRNQK